MRLLLASNSLSQRGGSETYLLGLGQHLQRFGHEVHLLEGPGGDGALPAAAGLMAVRSAGALPHRPDRAIVQDAIVAGEVAAAWPDVPQVLVAHSAIHDLQLPAGLPSTVRLIVALNDRTASRAAAFADGIEVVRLRQPIDVGHFTPGPPPRVVPRRLLVVSNNSAPWRYDGLEQACTSRGMELQWLGAAGGQRVSDLSGALRDADIVVGYGRCILEGMACGRTAFVFDRFGANGWVDASSYPVLEASGFNGSADLDEPGFSDWDRMLDSYDHRTGAVGHDLVLRHHDARTHARDVIGLLDKLDGTAVESRPDLAFSLARVWREQWRWEVASLLRMEEADRLQATVHDLEAVIQELEATQSDLSTRLDGATQDATAATQEAEEARRALAEVVGSRNYRVARVVQRLRHPWHRPSDG